MATSSPRAGSVRSKLTVNTLLVISFVALSLPAVTRIPIHEWWSFAFCVIVALHLLFSWSWIVNVTRRLLASLRGEVRFNYYWDLVLYFTLAVVMVSGIVVSEVALPQMGFPHRRDPFWSVMHKLSSYAMMVMVGVHLAMHWDWVTAALERFVTRTLTRPAPRANASTWWVKPATVIALSAVLLSGISLAMGFTPQADRIRDRLSGPRPAPRPARSSAPTAGMPEAPAVVTTPGEALAARARAPRQAPPRPRLKTRLFRDGRTLAIFMGIPFVFTLAALWVGGRLRGSRRADAGDPLEQRAS